MPNKLTQQEFVAKSVAMHGAGRYDYSLVSYSTSQTKVEIVCPKHGVFQQMPASHMQGNGCSQCGSEQCHRSKRHSTADFIKAAQRKHGNKYDYSEAIYAHNQTHVKIVCPQHGSFEQRPRLHITGRGCPECAKSNRAKNRAYTTKEFIDLARAKHGDRYDYSSTKYRHNLEPVKIICPRHGAFSHLPRVHLSRGGCPECTNIQKRLNWVEQANGRECVLYLLRVFDASEAFIKVGITFTSIKHRYSGKGSLADYNYQVLALCKSFDAQRIWDWERSILSTFAPLSYIPQKPFAGASECFSSAEEILAIFPL